MELRAGYKQTELGVIPDDWDISILHQICDVRDGTHDSPKFIDRGISLVTSKNIINGRINFDNIKFISENDAEKINKRSGVSKNDILMSMIGSIGDVALIDEIPDFCIKNVALIKSGKLNKDYIFHYLKGLTFQATLSNQLDGGIQKFISLGKLRNSLIIHPTLPKEQQAIAEALGDADALIDGLEKLIAKKRLIKQGAMQELLTGKRRLPGFSGEWQETTLFELANMSKAQFDDGDWVESEHIKDKGIRLVQTGNVGIGKFLNTSNKKYINELSFNSLRCKEIYPSDLLICRLADPAGRACILPEIDEERIITSVDITIFRPRSESADKNFLLQIFCTPEWLQNVSDKSGGTTHKRVSRGALGKLLIKMPEVAEQNALGLFFADMDVEISTLEAKLEKARQIKQGMMQELLTGRIRLI